MFFVNFKAFLRFQFANQFIFMLLFQDHQFNLQTQPPTLRVNFKSFYLCYFVFLFLADSQHANFNQHQQISTGQIENGQKTQDSKLSRIV